MNFNTVARIIEIISYSGKQEANEQPSCKGGASKKNGENL